MKKRISAFFIGLITLLIGASIGFYALAEPINWEYDSLTKTLVISGSGDMEDYSNGYSQPWYKYIDEIENVIIEDGITSVGAYSFSGATNLINVNIPNSVSSINDYAFSSCSSLEELTFGENISYIADSSMAFDGITQKTNFTLIVSAGTFSLDYAIKNNIDFNCKSVNCGTYNVNIVTKGMYAYFPYTAKVSGTFKAYSTGVHDTYGYVYDSSFKILKSNDDMSSNNTNFSLNYDLIKGNTYYFAVKIYNSTLIGTFDFTIEPVSYTVSGMVYAMGDKKGNRSDIILENSTINGEPTSNGYFTFDATKDNENALFECDGKVLSYTFNPDKGETQDIVISMCDVNSDGVVNGKDFAIMRKSNSKYLSLFSAFADYRE